ncbi:MAG: alpha-ketoglutarate-dependent 2,4-dichlorophenoxyacetate dioxygenase [Planctomycetota bacterium]|jgi:alpha-ketoglutarate-dependent 2,4-dichlorophenoxyacetate dioxygenase
MQITPLHDEIGACVTGVDLSLILSDAQFAKIDEAINQYSVLLFRDQQLDDDLHTAFTRRFGELEEEHVSYYSRGEITYIGTVGNIDADGRRLPNSNRGVRSGTGNQLWHSDSSFREVPSLHSILYAYEVSAEGGDTEFVSARAAYQRLDADTQSSIDNLVGIHDYIYSRTSVSEDAVNQGQRAFMYPVRQKLVRTNPHNGEKNFYVGSHVRDIDGWQRDDSRPLLDALMNEATRAESIYRHRWQVGDLLMWDNRCVLHRGCGFDADKYRRRKHQTRVRGRGPTLAET